MYYSNGISCCKRWYRKITRNCQDVTKIINFIKGRALIHREFNSFLEEIDPDLTGLLYYTDVRWLSKGKMSARFFPEYQNSSIGMGGSEPVNQTLICLK